MEFRLCRMVLAAGRGREISKTEFMEIKRARDIASSALGAEQKFDMVIENYFEFERELLELSLQHSLSLVRPWESFAHDRQRVNRRLGNLTFATKLFSDQMKHDAASIFGRRSAERKELEAAMEDEGRSLPHRVLIALRDRMQHQSFPKFLMTYQSAREGDLPGGEWRLHFWLDLVLAVSDLEEGRRSGDRKIAKLIEDLADVGEEVDLLDFARKHVESIARVFERFRKLMDGRLEDAEALIEKTIERARQEEGEGIVGLAAIAIDAGQVVEEVQLFEDAMKYRRALRSKNRGIDSISKRFVSSVSKTLSSV